MPDSPTPSGTIIAIECTVTVQASISEVFERWCRVEDYPLFMEGVREIRWLDEKRFSLKSENGGQYFHSLCELTLRIPERRMAWRTLEGPDSSGVACFQNAGGGSTDVTLKMRYNPEGGWSDIKQVEERLRRNLDRFKALVEGGKSIAV